MTNEKLPSDETDHGSVGLEHDPDTLKRGVFAEWKAEHPDGSPQQFDAAWAAMTNEKRPSDTTTRDASTWEAEAAILKHRFFEEWIALRPDATRQQFEDAWSQVKATFGT